MNPIVNDLSTPLDLTHEAIVRKHAKMWDCTGRSPSLLDGKIQGFIYHFTLKPEYDFVTPKLPRVIKERKENFEKINYGVIFPAIEPNGHEAIYYGSPEKCGDKVLEAIGLTSERLEDRVVMHVPDPDVIVARFNQFVSAHPELNLRPLRLLTTDGIAEDLTFVRAYPNCDVLISSDGEFLHDFFVHFVRLISVIMSDPEGYYREKERVSQVINTVLNRITDVETLLENPQIPIADREELKAILPQIKTAVGATVDSLWGALDLQNLKMITLDYFDQEPFKMLKLLNIDEYKGYWIRRFGKPINFTQLKTAWSRSIELGQTAAIGVK